MSQKFWVETLPKFLLPFVQIANALVVATLMFMPVYLTGCSPPVYVVRQYSGDKIINEWKTKGFDWNQGACTFKDVDGNIIRVSGTVTITKEEDQK